MNKEYKFLLEDEKVIRELQKGLYFVRQQGRKPDYSTIMYTIDQLLRKPVLTNKRLILLKEEIKFPFHKLLEIDYEIPIETIESVESDISWSNPWLRVILKNGDVISLLLTFTGSRAPIIEPFIAELNIIDQWVLSINNLILLRK
jgi:hypothetical protein